MPPAIITFTKVALPYGWLSNMSPHPIELDGEIYRTAEHLFQCLRFDEEDVARDEVCDEASPMRAKFVARANASRMIVQPRSEQDVTNMASVLRLKVAQHPKLRHQLVDTGDALIVEDVTRRPSTESALFWGMARDTRRKDSQSWEGRNQLGKLWMQLRDQLRTQGPLFT